MEEWVAATIARFAYEPMWVYAAICGFMLLSGFGMPIPEEVILISAGLVGYMALHPEKFPPLDASSTPVNVYVLALVAFGAVIFSDYLVFFLGQRYGPALFKAKGFARLVNEERLGKIQDWMKRYGSAAVLVFRFTPGIRFPGHLSCGAMGMPAWKFIGLDWVAAIVSVPTQVLLVAYYGEFILKYFTRFKIYLFSVLAIALAVYFTLKVFKRGRREFKPPEIQHDRKDLSA